MVGYKNVWVYRLHASYTYLKPGWQFVPDADVAQLTADGCIVGWHKLTVKALPHRIRSTFTP